MLSVRTLLRFANRISFRPTYQNPPADTNRTCRDGESFPGGLDLDRWKVGDQWWLRKWVDQPLLQPTGFKLPFMMVYNYNIYVAFKLPPLFRIRFKLPFIPLQPTYNKGYIGVITIYNPPT